MSRRITVEYKIVDEAGQPAVLADTSVALRQGAVRWVGDHLEMALVAPEAAIVRLPATAFGDNQRPMSLADEAAAGEG